jgi:AcrR family transcriptional regulator
VEALRRTPEMELLTHHQEVAQVTELDSWGGRDGVRPPVGLNRLVYSQLTTSTDYKQTSLLVGNLPRRMPGNGNARRRLVHEAALYSSVEEYLGRLVPFLRDGLAADQPVTVVVTPDKAALLRDALGAADAQRVSFLDARALYSRPAQAIAAYRHRVDTELLRPDVELVRVAGEIQFGRGDQEHTNWMRYESVFNRAFAADPAWVVCMYDTRALPEQVVAGAHCTHPLVSIGDRRDPSTDYNDVDEVVEGPLARERDGNPLAQLTVTTERDLGELRRAVSGLARAAGLTPTIVDDVTLSVSELVRDALCPSGREASVQIVRAGAHWHCDVSYRDADKATLGESLGLSIARLISDRIELGSAEGVRTVRLTLAGAEEARQRILDAASELFYQHGIRATGTNTVIAHAGVAKATFFHHFPAKEGLILAWLQQPSSRWFDRIRAELDAATESPGIKLLTFFDLLGEWFARDDFRGCAFQNAAAETPAADHPLRQAIDDYEREIERYLRRTAKAAGLSNPARVAEQLHLLAQGAIANAVATRSADAARVARAAANRLLK